MGTGTVWPEVEGGSLAERLSREASSPELSPQRRRCLDFGENLRAVLAPELEVVPRGEGGLTLRWRAGVYEADGTPRSFEAVVLRDPLLSIITSNNPARARRPQKHGVSRKPADRNEICRAEDCPFHSSRIGTDPAGYLLVPGHLLPLGGDRVTLRVTSAKVNLYPSFPGQFVILEAFDNHWRVGRRPEEEVVETVRALQGLHRLAREVGAAKGLDLWRNEGPLGFASLPHPHWQLRPRFAWEGEWVPPLAGTEPGFALGGEPLWSGGEFALALEPSLAELRLVARRPGPFDALDGRELAEILRRLDRAFGRVGVGNYNFMVSTADFAQEEGRRVLLRAQAREGPYTASNQAGLEFLHDGRFRLVALDLEGLRGAVLAELEA